MRPLLRHSRERVRRTNSAEAAFTLVEMILAIGIAVGLLIVALTFHRQATDLRAQILQASERNAAIRLVFDRLAADLRTARAGGEWADPFVGTGDSLSFTRYGHPAGPVGATAGAGFPGGDVVRVSFSAWQGSDGTNRVVVGFDRREEIPGAPAPASSLSPSGSSTNLSSGDAPGLAFTNQLTAAREPLTDAIRFVRFRYWDGAGWQEGWTNGRPPAGVEVVLGMEPLPPEATPEEYPFEQFRRVIVVPAGLAQGRPATRGMASPPPAL